VRGRREGPAARGQSATTAPSSTQAAASVRPRSTAVCIQRSPRRQRASCPTRPAPPRRSLGRASEALLEGHRQLVHDVVAAPLAGAAAATAAAKQLAKEVGHAAAGAGGGADALLQCVLAVLRGGPREGREGGRGRQGGVSAGGLALSAGRQQRRGRLLPRG
jgi:hypothetical protein